MSNSDRFISATKIQTRYGISSSSLRRWDSDGRVETIRTPGGFRLYRIQDIERLFGKEEGEIENEPKKAKICYARVSSDHQKEDLKRQVNDLEEKYPDHEIIKDIGSGLNYKRKGFQTLLQRVYEGNVSEVVVAHRDRLCRYGFELVEFIFKKADAKIVVLGQVMEEQNATRELADDLLAVCNYFVAKNNGIL
jgi:putative resolvase